MFEIRKLMFVQKASHLLPDFWLYSLLDLLFSNCLLLMFSVSSGKKIYIDSVFSNIGLLSRFIKNCQFNKMFVKLKGFNVINFSLKSKILKNNHEKTWFIASSSFLGLLLSRVYQKNWRWFVRFLSQNLKSVQKEITTFLFTWAHWDFYPV